MRKEFADLPREVLDSLSCKPTDDFTCAVCGTLVDCCWNSRGPDRQIPPICNHCERVSGYGWNGRPRYRSNLKAGSFMDRRNATRILALSEEIASAAMQKEWSSKHGA